MCDGKPSCLKCDAEAARRAAVDLWGPDVVERPFNGTKDRMRYSIPLGHGTRKRYPLTE